MQQIVIMYSLRCCQMQQHVSMLAIDMCVWCDCLRACAAPVSHPKRLMMMLKLEESRN
jgi:hypothetical protein